MKFGEKKITISGDADQFVIECTDTHKPITINRQHKQINAKEIYDLLNYKSGDIYEVSNQTQKSDEDIVLPIVRFFEKLVSQINELPSTDDKCTDDLAEFDIDTIEKDPF